MARHGGKILIDCLRTLGARHSFGVPGESYLAALDALHDSHGALDFTLCRNEGGAAFMAAAYGKLTGQPGICFVTRGPGATNASIGVHTARQDSVPMILFVGQVGSDMIGREAFQEVDYRATFGDLAKWAVEIDRLDRMPEIIARAWSTAMSGRPGPVVVALPEDMLSATSDVADLRHGTLLTEAAPASSAITQAADMLNGAKRPLILAGGQGWTKTGKAALKQTAEVADIPVLAGFRFLDVMDNNSPCFVGDAGVGMTKAVQDMLAQSDMILALNLRLGEMTTHGFSALNVPHPAQGLIHIHSSDWELGKTYVPDLAIHSGPNEFAQALAAQDISGPWAQWRAQARASYDAGFAHPGQPGPVDMVAVMAHLRDVLPDDAILTNGAGNFATWPTKFFRFGPDHRLLSPQSGAMGFGLPAAIAAKITHPERAVVCFAGDGDFQMNCPELGTAMQAGAQPIILILNNGMYGTIRMHQERHYPARISGTTLENPDFALLARSYGFHGEVVAQTADFPAAFARAQASDTGAVLDLRISADAITPHQTLSQIRATAQS